MGDLTKDFDRSEFVCGCGCGADRVDPPFLWKLQYMRDQAQVVFNIISGCRCPKYNEDEGGYETSDHITTDTLACEGADIECKNSTNRFIMLDAAILAGFRRIGIGKTFIHIGNRSSNPQKVSWLY